MQQSSTYLPGINAHHIRAFLQVCLLIGALAIIFPVIQFGDHHLAGLLPGDFAWLTPLLDPLIHLVLGLLVVSPVLLANQKLSSFSTMLVVAALSAVLIDVDHVFAAGSISLNALTHLSGRPPTHSILFALLAGLLTGALTRNFRYGWVIFAVLVSHIIRDASGGGTPYLLWPFSSGQVSQPIYHAVEMGLYGLSILAVTFSARVPLQKYGVNWAQSPNLHTE